MRYLLQQLWESLRIALRSIRVHKLRAMLTTLGIVIGIVTVTVMATVINGIEREFDEGMEGIGMNVVYVQRWPWGFDTDWWKYINRPPLQEGIVDVIERRSRHTRRAAPFATTGQAASYAGRSISGLSVEGGTPDYARIRAIDVGEGRLLDDADERAARPVCVVGVDVAEALFPHETPLGKRMRLGRHPCTVVGVLEAEGRGLGGENRDARVLMPFSTFKKYFGLSRWRSVNIAVQLAPGVEIADAKDELTGIVRAARRQDAREEDNFAINDQQTLREQMAPVKFAIYGIGLFLTALSLLVGGIGVMNIMFVSVRERTREIGIRKAVGARPSAILMQFLIESVIVCLIGGAIGIALAFPLTLLVQQVMPAVLPLSTVLAAFAICAGLGIVFGLAPAWSAARAQPIEALRYE